MKVPIFLADTIEKEFEYHGFTCIVRRGPMGALNGYVVLPEGHRYYGKNYDDIPVEIHGGLTYSEFEEEHGYMIGFDCAHFMDLVPEL